MNYDFSASFAESLHAMMDATCLEMQAHANLRKPLSNFIPFFAQGSEQVEQVKS